MSPSSGDDFLRIGRRIRVLPIIHGSGDCAVGVRAEMLQHAPDCLAVPLPPSFQEDVEAAVLRLPVVSAVVQRDAAAPEGQEEGFSYVPIDPCQGVIAALRLALGEHIPRVFIDRETPWFEANAGVFPDPYALKKVSPAGFAAAVLPAVGPPSPGQHTQRIRWMAQRLRELERRHRSILFVCSLLDWPWVRQAYQQKLAVDEAEPFYAPVRTFASAPRTLTFLLGELPFLTGLYERGRFDLGDDENLSIDGVKEMVLAARDRLRQTHPRVAQRITPQLLTIYFRYVRNLSLLGRRLTPDLYTLVTAAQQTAGDGFALALAETASEYPYLPSEDEECLRMGVAEADVPGWGVGAMANRLPGHALSWQAMSLRPRPTDHDRARWKQQHRWNPYSMCTWPAEDDWRDHFNKHVRDQALALLGADLARSEKFTTSVMDGLDVRETLRHWHTGDLYVKVQPPSRGAIEVVVFLFDVPADPRRYPQRATWAAEHGQQSMLTFFATDLRANILGPGVAQCEYGGAMLLFPPRLYRDVWTDPLLDFTDTLEERLLAGALLHSQERHVVVVCPRPPSALWRRLARRFGKKLVHLPMSRFSAATIDRLRRFHVLNGAEVRSYAADFIRDFS